MDVRHVPAIYDSSEYESAFHGHGFYITKIGVFGEPALQRHLSTDWSNSTWVLPACTSETCMCWINQMLGIGCFSFYRNRSSEFLLITPSLQHEHVVFGSSNCC